jgi:putative CocE/NonD family hydrolase
MKIQKFTVFIAILLSISLISCKNSNEEQQDNYVQENYDKMETSITMRDGVKLFTSIYMPKDKSKSYPILMQRTPYSVRPYGSDKFRRAIGPNKHLMKDGYIIVYQDVRGRWMSEGTYDNMRAYIPNKNSDDQVDESSDTYDTIDWLVNNVPSNNGKVGTWGISYPGFYSTCSTIDAHPATSLFGTPRETPTDTAWYSFKEIKSKDGYQFFLDAGPLSNLNSYFQYDKLDSPELRSKDDVDDFFWKELIEHPNYDEVWQSKGIIQHLKKINSHVATMVVGGQYDAEDLYGPLETYKTIEEYNSENYNTLVFGPWSHGQWASSNSRNSVGNYYFGDSISLKFQQEIEYKFFDHFLKGSGDKNSGLPEAYVYDVGKNKWDSFESWPPEEAKNITLYLGDNQELTAEKPEEKAIQFVSNIKKPVPYSEDIKVGFIPQKYMTDDQRFAARRSDVLVFETDRLEEDLTLTGEIMANLEVATTGTDADWIVKVIDVHPDDFTENEEMQDHLKMSNYHLMVRSEVMRGKFRNSFSNPEPFKPNKKTAVKIKLQDIHHTFRKGHKLQIQVQSTWFPLIDLNPQTFVPNIFKASEEDFKTQTHTVFTSSNIEFSVID